MKRLKSNVYYLNYSYMVRKPQNEIVCTLEFAIDLNLVPGIETLWKDQQFRKMVNKMGKLRYYKDNSYPDLEVFATDFANCKNGDEFDKEFGRKLVMTRVQKKAFLYARNFYNKCKNLLNKHIENLDKYTENCNMNYIRCKGHAHTLIERKYNS